MTVGADGMDSLAVFDDVEVHAVQVVTHIFVSHGEADFLHDVVQGAALDFDASIHVSFRQRRKIFGGQGGNAEDATSSFHQQLFFVERAVHSSLRRQVTHHIKQFACWYGNGAFFLDIELVQKDLQGYFGISAFQ